MHSVVVGKRDNINLVVGVRDQMLWFLSEEICYINRLYSDYYNSQQVSILFRFEDHPLALIADSPL